MESRAMRSIRMDLVNGNTMFRTDIIRNFRDD